MADEQIIFNNPTNTINKEVIPDNCSFGQKISESATFVMEFESNWDEFLDEGDATNVGQIGAFITVTDGDQIFEGTIKDKILSEGEGGERKLEITAYDKIHNLKDTLALDGSKSIFSKTTPAITLTEEALVAGEEQEDAQFPYFINTSGTNWLPITGGDETINTTLDADINAVVTTIVFTTTYVGLMPRGYLAIVSASGTEYVYYDGLDDATAGNKFTARNCVRGALGSSGLSHTSATAKVSQWLSMGIHPDAPVILEAFNTDDADWEALPSGYYGLQVEEGRFDMGFDIFAIIDGKTGNLKYTSGSGLRMSCAFFEELSVDAVLFEDLATDVLTTAQADLGTGLSAGDINVDVDEIRFKRIYIKEPTNVTKYIDKLISLAEFSGGEYINQIGYWYNHKTSKVEVKTISQGTPTFFYPSMSEFEFDKSEESVYTAVEVSYNLGSNTNLAAPTRMWHYEVGDTVGGQQVEHIWFQDTEEPNADGWSRSTQSGHNIFTERTVDSFKNTGFGVGFDGNPSTDVDILYCWFNDDLDEFVLDEINIIIDPRRESIAGSEIEIEVLGITGFSKVDPPSSTSFFSLSGGLNIRYPEGNIAGTAEVPLVGKDIGKSAEAIAIRFKGLSSDGGTFRYGRIKEINITGNIVRTATVKLSNSAATSSTDLYDPEVYNKLVSSHSGFTQFKTKQINIGPASYNAAVSLGRLELLQSLAVAIEKTFLIDQDDIDGIPVVGDTVQFGSDLTDTGIVTKVAYNFNSEGEKVLLLTVIDFTTDIVGDDIDL